jgi:hypothetical protein
MYTKMVQKSISPIDNLFCIWLISYMRLAFHEALKIRYFRHMQKINGLFTNFLKERMAGVQSFFQLWIIVP